jgi:hypothetical protein
MKLIKKIFISCLLVLLILFGLEWLYGFGLRHNANLKAAYVQMDTMDVDLLIHGPCEPLWMISPALLDPATGKKSYNLSLSHSDFADNFLHLYFYLKKNPAPKAMFLYVTPESMDPAYNTFNTFRFAAYLGDPVVDSVVKDCDPEYFRYHNLPFMRYAYYNSNLTFEMVQGFKHYFKSRRSAYYPDGFEPPVQRVWDNHLEEFIRLYPKGYNFRWDPLREKYLEKNIQLAQQHGIEVYLYESPVLQEAVASTPNRQEMVDRIAEVAEKYGIKYVQFRDIKIEGSRNYYMSPLNTNKLGSAIFTDSLASYLNKVVFK